MYIDPQNPVVKLCVSGMEQEMAGRPAQAKQLFQEAWDRSVTEIEKFTAAHYLARVQDGVVDKLKWDQIALKLALEIDSLEVKATFPSLYLNVGKCFEDLNNKEDALAYYTQAQSYIDHLQDDGYGRMIRAGIAAGIERVK